MHTHARTHTTHMYTHAHTPLTCTHTHTPTPYTRSFSSVNPNPDWTIIMAQFKNQTENETLKNSDLPDDLVFPSDDPLKMLRTATTTAARRAIGPIAQSGTIWI